ncbi:hypothetical protein HYC85_030318 [Camellia sinensis]|uniref:Uncharacterized protein n=1 Tax=Camellia sinensis TaxID=4442 RepID=A0A7J7G124_CAMSI|nr:hypothetical protein HYC85_030318 [Camellia sinensis]
MLSKEACKARSKVALELGAKMSDVLQDSKDESFLKIMKTSKKAKFQQQREEKYC